MVLGLIVNPVSSKDIRRLVALGRVVDVEEKANLVARLLAGVAGGPPARVLALDDHGGVARRGLRLAGWRADQVSWLPVPVTGTEADTVAAAAALREADAALVVLVGGDGTARAAVEGWPEIPLLMLPAGTNNAFAPSVEPTVAGLAAAHAGRPDVAQASFRRRPVLVVDADGQPARAVVDAVGTTDRWGGARALWRPADLVEAMVTRADPGTVGMAGAAATLGPLRADRVRHLRFGPGRPIRAVFGPGLVVDLSVAEATDVPPGRRIAFHPRVGVVALDGERRVIGGARASVVAQPGPWCFDPVAALSIVFRPQ